MVAGDMVGVYFDIVLKTSNDKVYQLKCVAVKEGEDAHDKNTRHS